MANGTISPSLIYLPRTCHLEENKTLCYVCHKRRVRCAYPPYGDEANVRFCMAGALALTRLTVMRLMLVLYGGYAALTRPAKMRDV